MGCAVYHLKMYVSKTNDKSISKESSDFGAKVVSMFEAKFNKVAVAA